MADVPGVIKILDWFESTESFFIVMEKFVGQVSILLISPPQLDCFPLKTLMFSIENIDVSIGNIDVFQRKH